MLHATNSDLYCGNFDSGSDKVPLIVSILMPRKVIDVAGPSTFSSFSGTPRHLQVSFNSSRFC